jgi:uncharacterized delta-60 repeat protein
VSHSMYRRRRRWRTFASTLALTLGSLAIPATALADGAIDPNFNGTGYAVGPLFSGQDNRVPMVIESDGKIVVGGSSGGSMTLLRYNLDGSLDTTFGSGGAAQRQFAGTPTGSVGTSGATAMTLDTNGDILVAGYGGSQSMFVARYTAGGTYRASAVCFAPHLIDYSARALAIRPNGNIVLVGYAHDRHAAVLDPTQPVVTYGQRAVVPLAANAVGNSTTACGLYTEVNNLSRGSAGVTIDGLGHDGTVLDATLAGRQYDAVSATGNNGYTVASTIGPDGAGWLARYTAAGALDPAFNGGARLPISGVSFHALKALADGSVLAAGDTPNGALASDRQMVVAKVAGNGTMAAFGSGGIARITVGSGDNTAQALAVQADNRVIVGGAAIVGGRAGLGLARFTATGDIDGNSAWSGGQTTTAIPDGAAYVTGMALNGNVLGVSGRASITGGIAPVAARYYAIGDPPPVPVPPAPPVVVPTSPGGGTTGSGTTTGGGTTTSRGGTTTGGGVTQATAKKKNVVKQCIVPKVTGKAVNKARSTVLSKGCKVAVVYKKSHKKKGTVLSINRKAGKKLVYRALVKMTIAKPF